MAYNPTNWVPGTFGTEITSARLNNIETGVGDAQSMATRPSNDRVVYVSTSGSDSNGGRALGIPFLTIAAALTALGTSPGTVQVAGGTYSFSSTLARYGGQRIVGAGRKNTTLTYTGSGTAIGVAVSGTRIYSNDLADFTLTTTTGTIGVDMDSISESETRQVTVTGFSDRGFYLHSSVSGGCVYNAFVNTLAFGKGPATASIGFDVAATGSNSNNWVSCGARNCGVGLNITDCNQNVWFGGTFEVDGIGVQVDATAPSLSNSNAIRDARFEGNTQNWNVASSNVRYTRIKDPAEITAAGTGVDNGTWSQIDSPGSPSKAMSTATANAAGAWRFERTANGGSELPAVVVSDSATSSGTPVTIQTATERATGYAFRATRAGTNYFDIDAAGNVRQPQGSYFEMVERSDPSTPASNTARLYVKDNGSGATQIVAKFPSGAVQAISTDGVSGGSYTSPDVQFFTTTGANTWTKPAGAKTVYVHLVGGGGGGGSGRRGAAASVRCGGGSGAGGGVIFRQFDAADLGSTVTVTVGTGGAGGAAVTADSTSGNNGSAGARTTFGSHLAAALGNPGLGGTASTGTGGAGVIGAAGSSGAGSSASTTGGVGVAAINAYLSAPGGGSGGGITSADVAGAGGNGGAPYFGNATGGVGAGGAVDSTAPTGGTAASAHGSTGPGAGGGAASITTAAQAGADAPNYGGGGGGGGASLNGNNSGAGGAGAQGCALVITYF